MKEQPRRFRQRSSLSLPHIRQAAEEVFGVGDRIAAVVLYGSYARGRVRGASDVDMALLPTPDPVSKEEAVRLRGEWQDRMTKLLGGCPAHLVILPHAPLLLRRNVTREGQLLLERQVGVWHSYRRRVRHEWRDRARVRERFWRRFLRRWEEVGFGERYGDHSAALDAMRRVRETVALDGGRD
jgi:predicted nucleotidyltransferase